MAWGLPAEISSMQFDDDVVPLNGTWCVRLRCERRGFGGWMDNRKVISEGGRGLAGLKPGAYMESGVEAESR